MVRFAAIVVTVWAVVALHATGTLAQGEPEPYQIVAGDTLQISILEDPGLNSTVLVRPDGRISLPLAGTIIAAGRTPEAVQASIRRALSSAFVAPPTVTVSLTGLGEQDQLPGIYIIGEIGNPGRYDVELPIDILQFLAVAGGPSDFAATRRIQIRRTVDGQQSVILFDYEAVMDGTLPITPIALRNGDVVVVPQAGLFE